MSRRSVLFHSYLLANFFLQSPIISECFFMQVLSTRDAVRSKITIRDRIFIVYALERKLLLFSFEIVLRSVNAVKDKFHSTRPSSHMKLNRYAPNNTRTEFLERCVMTIIIPPRRVSEGARNADEGIMRMFCYDVADITTKILRTKPIVCHVR